MKGLSLLLVFNLLILTVSAQVDREPQAIPETPLIRITENRLYGKITDVKTNKGIPSASVELWAVSTDTLQNQDSVIGVMFSKANGDFNFRGLPSVNRFRLIITAVGYEKMEKDIDLVSGEQPGDQKIEKDLGNVEMAPAMQQLGMVTVVASKPTLQMGIDRKVFNVEKSLTSTGGTGLDVMKNIPSVRVDVDGNILLRNASPQIFVDGRPTILTLDQIPADNIERVELITNPSAKFDAASSGGIINVILKKNIRIGLNGIASVGTGIPGVLTGNLNVSLRQGKFNFFAGGNYNRSTGKSKSETLRQNKEDGVIENYFNQHSGNKRLRRFESVRFGVDYFIDNRNTLTISQHIVQGRFNNNQFQRQEYLDSDQSLLYNGERNSDGHSQFNRNTTRLNYTHKFPEQGKELTANINYNYGGGEDNSSLLNRYFNPDGSVYSPDERVRNAGKNNSDQWTFQVDFTLPKNDKTKLETGIRSYINNFNSVFNAFGLDNGAEVKLPLSNNYEYQEMINAFYLTYTGKWHDIGYQFGLRAEQSKFDGNLIDSAKKFGYNYPEKLKNIWDALFPSAFFTKQLNEKSEIQLNYTRRIRRPNFWELNPFIDINDPVNLRQGNPQLKPESTNSFEFNYSQRYGKGNNFLGSIYYRNNQGDITRYSDTISAAQYQRLNNAAVDPNAILNTFINARSTNRLGAEFTLQHKMGNHFDITPSLDLQYRKVNAKINDLNLSNEGFNWEAKLITNYKIVTEGPSLFNNLGFQLTGQYESPEVIPQGRRLERYSVDFALRKEFLKNKKAAFTFSINDVFNTEKYGTIYDTEDFYQKSYGRWNIRTFRVGFTYKFGQADFALFKKPGTSSETREED